jgi:hypothetical protein
MFKGMFKRAPFTPRPQMPNEGGIKYGANAGLDVDLFGPKPGEIYDRKAAMLAQSLYDEMEHSKRSEDPINTDNVQEWKKLLAPKRFDPYYQRLNQILVNKQAELQRVKQTNPGPCAASWCALLHEFKTAFEAANEMPQDLERRARFVSLMQQVTDYTQGSVDAVDAVLDKQAEQSGGKKTKRKVVSKKTKTKIIKRK